MTRAKERCGLPSKGTKAMDAYEQHLCLSVSSTCSFGHKGLLWPCLRLTPPLVTPAAIDFAPKAGIFPVMSGGMGDTSSDAFPPSSDSLNEVISPAECLLCFNLSALERFSKEDLHFSVDVLLLGGSGCGEVELAVSATFCGICIIGGWCV